MCLNEVVNSSEHVSTHNRRPYTRSKGPNKPEDPLVYTTFCEGYDVGGDDFTDVDDATTTDTLDSFTGTSIGDASINYETTYCVRQ